MVQFHDPELFFLKKLILSCLVETFSAIEYLGFFFTYMLYVCIVRIVVLRNIVRIQQTYYIRKGLPVPLHWRWWGCGNTAGKEDG